MDISKKMASLGYLLSPNNIWKNGNQLVKHVSSSEFDKDSARILWREEWKDFFAIIYDYSAVKGPVCIVPTKALFGCDWVNKKRIMDSYANSGFWWSNIFPIDHELVQLVLSYNNNWEILTERIPDTIKGK